MHQVAVHLLILYAYGALIFLLHADKPIHCVAQLIGLLSLLCFPLCHKENLDFSKMFISWLCWVLLVACGIVIVLGGIFHCDVWTVVVALGLSCCMTCWILVPQAGLELMAPALQGRFLTTGPPGKPLHDYLNQRTTIHVWPQFLNNINLIPARIMPLKSFHLVVVCIWLQVTENQIVKRVFFS